jgi:hypothetical protein
MSLSSLIVQREIASIREIEEALARQVLYGGDFVTNLFEVSRIEEATLMPIVAESYGLPSAPTGELPKVPKDAVRLIAAEVVAERCFAPLELGASLVVAVAEPLAYDAEQDLTFALALPIEQRIAPLFRIRQALARDYGVPLDKRIARLITKVVHKGPRIASTFPPPLESSPNHRPPPRPPSLTPPPPPRAPAPIKTVTHETFVRKTEATLRPTRRRRGPLTAEVAKTELEASAERDVIFDLLFEFARQFFDYTALFIVHGDIAEGRDAFGEGASREKVARVGVPLDLRNILASAREQKKLVRTKPQSEGLDPVLMADLGRDGTTECVVFPVVVRTRVVALLFGDGGQSGVDDVGVAQVEQLVESASGAFERVIMRRKLKGSEPAPEAGVARANAKKKAADSAPPPPTQVSAPPAAHRRSERPAAEELAAPVRDLMAEPMSGAVATTREPSATAMTTTMATVTAGLLVADPMAVRSDPPPPVNILAVRRPSGAPIPREEPESRGAFTRGIDLVTPSVPPAPNPVRTRSQSLKRAEAPRFEFGMPAMPSVVTESTTKSSASIGSDDALEHQVRAQLDARPPRRVSEPPRTTRDSEAGSWMPASAERAPSASSQVHPWAGGASSAPDVPRDVTANVPAHSPRAESPPPMKSAPITDLSPQTIIGPINGADERKATIPDGAPPRPRADLTTTLVAGSPPLPTAEPDVEENPAPVKPLVVVTPDEETTQRHSASVIDPDATPLAPPVFDADVQPQLDADVQPQLDADVQPQLDADVHPTPLADTPGTGQARPSLTPEPVLALAQRKGAPPVLPAMPVPKPMPMSEQQVSVPAHKPPSSRSDYSRVLPSVIVDVSSEYVDLVERVIAGPDEDAETELLRAGGYAMPAIMTKFPGPTSVEIDRLESGPLPRVADCGPVVRLIASQRRTALPFVLSHVGGADAGERLWATYLLTELVYPDAIDAAVGRVFDEDARVRRVARAAVRALAEVHPQLVVERLGEIANAEADVRRVQAIEALGESREPLAVPILLPLLEDRFAPVVAASRAALVTITQQDFGRDADRWLNWWSDNRQRHRLEWLIDALMHDQRALRASASDELRTITKEYFAYYDDLPKRERERAQTRYREWWESVGRVRFSRASTRGA